MNIFIKTALVAIHNDVAYDVYRHLGARLPIYRTCVG